MRLVNVIRDGDGKQVTVTVHAMVLLAHHPAFRGLDKFPDGLETRHNPAVGDKLFNAYPEGMWPGTRPENEAERTASLAAEGRAANGRAMAAPKPPPAPCIRCGDPVTRGGRRCHECVVAIGVEATALMRAGVKLEAANEQLGVRQRRTTCTIWLSGTAAGGTAPPVRAPQPPTGSAAGSSPPPE